MFIGGCFTAGMSRASRLFFFFSSRRRHTRLVSDWSSDVCSSDLAGSPAALALAAARSETASGPPSARPHHGERRHGIMNQGTAGSGDPQRVGPAPCDDVVLTVSVELPGDPTGSGEDTAVVPVGRPATVSETLPTEPPTSDTSTVYLADCPREIVTDEGLTDSEKSRPETTSATATVCVTPPAVPVIVSG